MAATRHRKPFGEVEPYKVKPRKPKATAAGHNPAVQREFEATLAAERREAEAKAAVAERRRDEAPVTRGPRTTPKVSGRIKLPRVFGGFRRAALRSPRKVLLLEMVAVLSIVTVSRVSEGEAPKPADYLAPFVVYLVLAFAAEVGGSTGRLAAAFGALILLAVFVSHSGGIVRGLQVVTFGPGEGPVAFGSSEYDPRTGVVGNPSDAKNFGHKKG